MKVIRNNNHVNTYVNPDNLLLLKIRASELLVFELYALKRSSSERSAVELVAFSTV